MLCEKLPERRVHGRGVAKNFSYVWSEKHQIRACLVAGVILPPNPSRSRGLLGDFEILSLSGFNRESSFYCRCVARRPYPDPVFAFGMSRDDQICASQCT